MGYSDNRFQGKFEVLRIIVCLIVGFIAIPFIYTARGFEWLLKNI